VINGPLSSAEPSQLHQPQNPPAAEPSEASICNRIEGLGDDWPLVRAVKRYRTSAFADRLRSN